MKKSTIGLIASIAIIPLTAAPGVARSIASFGAAPAAAASRGMAASAVPVSTGIPITASSPSISGPGTMTTPDAIFTTSPFGNGLFGGWGFGYGGYPGYGYTDNMPASPQGFGLSGAAIPTQIAGPMQVLNTGSNAVPQAIVTRDIFTNGVPTTVSEPLVTEYHWATGVANEREKQYARVYGKPMR